MKGVAGTLRLDLAQYRELEAFAKFGSDLDKNTQAQLTRGERMVEILKQGQYVPMSVEKQVAIIFAVSKGYLDSVPADKVAEFESSLFDYLEANNADDLKTIIKEGVISDKLEASLEKATGYTITVVDANSYTITITGGETATIGNARGGGDNATSGSGTATPSTASTFDATNVTLDSATKTFDEG